ncbi:MAG: hypothetical protein WC178_05640, partial [Candidatus Paceibacterota bacterium]
MEEKRAMLDSENKKSAGFLSLGYKSSELVLLIALVAVSFIAWDIYNSYWFWMHLYFLSLSTIAVSLFILVADINYANRSRIFWFLGTGLFVAVFVLLFEIFNRLRIMNLFVLLAPVAIFYLVTFYKIVKDASIIRTTPAKAIKPTKILKLCLRSRLFNALLILMSGVFVYSLFLARQMVASSTEEMTGVFIIFMWMFVAVLFFVILFIGMAFVTRKEKKTVSSVILFTIFLIITLAIALIS